MGMQVELILKLRREPHDPMPTPISVLVVHPKNLLGDLILSALNHQASIQLAAYFASPLQFQREDVPDSAQVALIAGEFSGGPGVGMGLLRRVREWTPEVKPVMLYDTLDRDTVVEAFCNGAKGVLNTASCGFGQLCRCITQVNAGQIWANHSQVSWFVDAFATGFSFNRAAAAKSGRTAQEPLTRRESEIVKLLAEGNSNRKIAASLNLSENTIKNYLLKIFEKLGVSSRTELVAQTIQTKHVWEFPSDRGPFTSAPSSLGRRSQR